MFSVGDKIVYGTMGVCTVENICEMDIPGAARDCYLLIPKYVPNSKIYAPIENNPVEMRLLLSREEAELLIKQLPDIEPIPVKKEKQVLYEAYRTAIKSTDSQQLAKLIKSLYERKRIKESERKTFPIAEKEFFDKAEMILYGEIASAIGISIDEVEGYISERIDTKPAVGA